MQNKWQDFGLSDHPMYNLPLMQKLPRFSAYYLKIVGISILVSWIVILISGVEEKGKLELGFHLFSECILAFLCFLAGMLQGRSPHKFHGLALAAHGMLIYSVLNAAGYYAQAGHLAAVGIFIVMFFISVVLILVGATRTSRLQKE